MSIRFLSAIIFFIGMALVIPFLSPNQTTLANYIGIGATVAVGLVLIAGIGGLVSFGQATFAAIGAYSTAYLTTAYGFSPYVGLIAGFIITGLIAAVIGAVTLRLSGHFLPLSTIAWALSFFYLFGNLDFLGGHNGITGIPEITAFGQTLSGFYYTWMIWALLAIAMMLVYNLLSSKDGRAIRCLKGRRIMLEAFGINTANLRLKIFVIAALFASAAGWLYAHLSHFVGATDYGVNKGIEYMFMVILGGSTNIFGAVLGSGAITLLQNSLQDIMVQLEHITIFGMSLSVNTGAIQLILFGILILLILQWASGGLISLVLKIIPEGRKKLIDEQNIAKTETLPTQSKPVRGSLILSIKNATKRFGGLVAVNDVSFDLYAGEIVAVIGPNGAGKSTLFNLLTGVLPATAGEIHFINTRIDKLLSRKIAKLGIARSFQHVLLRSDMSVLENVAVGAYLRSNRGFLAALFRLDRMAEKQLLAEAYRHLEHVGLAHLAHENAGSLALGQQRIVEIARALAADPKLLLLDEPAAGLRHNEKQELAVLLNRLREEGVTVLIVEHDMNFVMNLVDRIVVISFGEKIAEGKPSEIQQSKVVQEAYLGG